MNKPKPIDMSFDISDIRSVGYRQCAGNEKHGICRGRCGDLFCSRGWISYLELTSGAQFAISREDARRVDEMLRHPDDLLFTKSAPFHGASPSRGLIPGEATFWLD